MQTANGNAISFSFSLPHSFGISCWFANSKSMTFLLATMALVIWNNRAMGWFTPDFFFNHFQTTHCTPLQYIYVVLNPRTFFSPSVFCSSRIYWICGFQRQKDICSKMHGFTSPLVNKPFVRWNAYKQNEIDPLSVELSSFVEPSFKTLIVGLRRFDGKAWITIAQNQQNFQSHLKFVMDAWMGGKESFKHINKTPSLNRRGF